MKKFLLSLMAVGVFLPAVSSAQEKDVTFYVGEGCQYCTLLEIWLDEYVTRAYPDATWEVKEVWNDEANLEELVMRLEEKGMSLSGVPTTFINEEVIVGLNAEAIERELRLKYGEPFKKLTIDDSRANSLGTTLRPEQTWRTAPLQQRYTRADRQPMGIQQNAETLEKLMRGPRRSFRGNREETVRQQMLRRYNKRHQLYMNQGTQ